MGSKKLLKKLTDFFDLDVRARQKRKDELNELLSRLKIKEEELKTERDLETDEKQKSDLDKKIDLVHSQRKKGITLLKELNNEDREGISD
jgi:hypothetical protein